MPTPASARPLRPGLALGFAAAALPLRLWGLGAQPLWFDEALTAHIAAAPDGLAFVHNTPPLYHWLVRLWAQVFGIGPFALRLPSALAGAAFVWLTFHTAERLAGRRAAVAAAAVATLQPLHVYYSQEARAYSLLLCLLMVVLWLLLRLAAGARWPTWLGLAAAGTAAVHTHYLAAFPLLAAHLLVPLLAPPGARGRALVRSLAAGALAALLLLPWWLWWAAHTPFDPDDMRWLELLWQQHPGLHAVLQSFELFALGAQAGRSPIFLKQLSTLPFADSLRIAGLIATALLLVLGAVAVRTRQRAAAPAMVVAALSCLAPLGCLWAVSTVKPLYAPGRYDLIAFPGFVLWLGTAIAAATNAATRLRPLAWLAVGVLAVVLAAKLRGYLAAAPAPDPAQPVAAHLADQVSAGDTVVLCGAAGLPVLVHLYGHGYVWSGGRCRAPDGTGFACRLLPQALEQAPAAASRYLRVVAQGGLAAELGALVPPAAGGSDVWLVLGEEFRSGGTDAAVFEAAGRSLFDLLFGRGYELDRGAPELGIAHLRSRERR